MRGRKHSSVDILETILQPKKQKSASRCHRHPLRSIFHCDDNRRHQNGKRDHEPDLSRLSVPMGTMYLSIPLSAVIMMLMSAGNFLNLFYSKEGGDNKWRIPALFLVLCGLPCPRSFPCSGSWSFYNTRFHTLNRPPPITLVAQRLFYVQRLLSASCRSFLHDGRNDNDKRRHIETAHCLCQHHLSAGSAEGLAMVATVTSMFFAAISGSSSAPSQRSDLPLFLR